MNNFGIFDGPDVGQYEIRMTSPYSGKSIVLATVYGYDVAKVILGGSYDIGNMMVDAYYKSLEDK